MTQPQRNQDVPEVPTAPNRGALRRASQLGLAGVVCLSALALGGAHVNVVLVATLTVAVCGAFALASQSLRRVPGAALVLAGLSAFSLLQTVPMPLAVLRRLSPLAAEIWQSSMAPFGETVAVGSLSLDPGASSVEAAKWAAYAVAFAIAAAFGRRRGATVVIAVVFASALVLALTTVGHALIGATRVFGLYEPQFAQPGWRLGPILNSNCLAGYLVLGASCGLGLIASRSSAHLNWIYWFGIALMSGLIAISSSRGGFAALIVSVAMFVLISVRTKLADRRRRSLSWYHWTGIFGVVVGGPVTTLLVVPGAWDLLVQRDTEKLQMWAWVMPMIRHFPWFGVGRGSFESAFAAYKPVANDLLYTHPENIVLQWLSEWGLVVGLGAFGSLLWLFRPSRFNAMRHASALGALLGVIALVLQNFVDLGLELFAPMLAATVVLGSCSGQVASGRRNSERLTLPWVGPALVGLLLLSVTLAFARGHSPVAATRLALEAEYRQLDAGKEAAARLWSSLRTAISQHPAEPYFPRLGALLALRTKKQVMPWIDSSLERCPVDSRTHWILAKVLQQHGFLAQALLEARLTAEYDPNMASTVGDAVATWSQSLTDLERAAPPGKVGGWVLYQAALSFKEPKWSELRESLFRAAVLRDPNSTVLQLAFAGQLLATFSTRCVGEARKRCEEEILGAAAALDRLSPESSAGSEVRANFYALSERVEEADRVLSARCPELDEPAQGRCWGALLSTVPRKPENRALIDRVVRRSVKSACLVDVECDAILIKAGDVMAELGDSLEALSYFERAVAKAPSVPSFLKVADVAQALGRWSIAARALDLAASRSVSDQEAARQIAARRQALHQLMYK